MMTQKRWTLLLISILAIHWWHAAPVAAAEKPNILLILIDDMGWKDIGCGGSTYYETPHIDQLASKGMRFLNAYSAAPTCSPSRGAIYTGKAPARTQLTAVYRGLAGPDHRLQDTSKYRGENDQFFEARHRHALPTSEVIIPQALADGGYQTGFFGKWHIGECPGYYPDQRGFHVAKGYRKVKANTGKSGHWMKTFEEYAAHLDGVDRDAYVADVLTTECIDFVTENMDRPWLAVLSHYLVHNPIQPKPEKVSHYQNKPKTDQTNPGYACMVESVDESVGRVIQTLDDLGIDKNTLVIFTSDNGGLTHVTSNYPLMGGKSFPFDAGMKIPLIAKWPTRIKPGTTSQRVAGMDLYPTMLAAAGLPLRAQQHVDGLDLMPVLTSNETLKKRPIIFHYPHYTHATGPFSAIIAENWKLIRFYNDAKGAYLLYDLASDPYEQNNLSDTNSEMLNKLVSQLDRSLTEMKAEMPIENPDFKPSDVVLNLKSTLDLAKKERNVFGSRLKQVRQKGDQ